MEARAEQGKGGYGGGEGSSHHNAQGRSVQKVDHRGRERGRDRGEEIWNESSSVHT